jgi:hypothetical protein
MKALFPLGIYQEPHEMAIFITYIKDPKPNRLMFHFFNCKYLLSYGEEIIIT